MRRVLWGVLFSVLFLTACAEQNLVGEAVGDPCATVPDLISAIGEWQNGVITIPELVTTIADWQVGCAGTCLNRLCQASFKGPTFFWGSNTHAQFTPEEFDRLAANYDLVVIGAAHGPRSWNITLHNEAALELKARNPNMEVLLYDSANFENIRTSWYHGFDLAWALRDTDGNRINFTGNNNNTIAYWIDLTNQSYRVWKRGVHTQIFQDYAFDGIAFDNAIQWTADSKPYFQPGPANTWRTWEELIGVQRRAEVNNALVTFLAETQAAHPGKMILWNGVSRKDFKVNRSLANFQGADWAFNEDWCLSHTPSGQGYLSEAEVIEDAELMFGLSHNAQGKRFVQKSHHMGAFPASDLPRISRYCYGTFLLGARPGKALYKFDERYAIQSGSIDENSLEIQLDIGNPTMKWQKQGSLYFKRFTGGLIVVNMQDVSYSFTFQDDVVLWNGNVQGSSYSIGDSVTIPARDAWFFVLQ